MVDVVEDDVIFECLCNCDCGDWVLNVVLKFGKWLGLNLCEFVVFIVIVLM